MGQSHKISFVGQPPIMDFALIKLNGGTPNLVDMATGAVYGLGPGEMVKMTADIGMTLKETLQANLNAMAPQDSVRVQIIIHSNSGLMFMPPNVQNARPSYMNQANFVLTGERNLGKQNIITARPKDGEVAPNAPREIIIVGGGQGFIQPGLIDVEGQSLGNIRHATAHENEENHDEDQGIMEAK